MSDSENERDETSSVALTPLTQQNEIKQSEQELFESFAVLREEMGHSLLVEQEWSDGDIVRALEIYYSVIVEKFKDVSDMTDYISHTLYIFGLDDINILQSDFGTLSLQFRELSFEHVRIYKQLYDRNLVDQSKVEGIALGNKLHKVIKNTHALYNVMQMMRVSTAVPQGNINPEDDPLRILAPLLSNPFDPAQKDDTVALITFLTSTLRMGGFRRHNGSVFMQKKIMVLDEETGERIEYNTHAWEQYCTIDNFPHRVIHKEYHGILFKHLVCKGHNAIEYLKHCRDMDFFDLNPDRHTFAFSNGVYQADLNRFMYHGDQRLHSSIVACKYFDIQFDYEEFITYEDPMDVPTPAFQSVLDYQELPRDVCKILYLMIGRLIYEVNEKDKWQVILFLKGVANTGKSTIANLCKSFYNPIDVGIISNNMQSTFALESLYDKFLCVCTEVKKSFTIDQGNLQSMASGEDVVVSRKFKTAEGIRWGVPLLLCGNEMGPWKDVGDALARRLIIINFPNKVSISEQKDDLDEMIEQEFPAFIYKCNLLYLQFVNAYPGRSIRGHLPDYFRGTTEEAQARTNTLVSFFRSNSHRFVFGEHESISRRAFQSMYETFCKEEGVSAHQMIRLNQDEAKSSLDERGLKFTRDERGRPIIKGLRIVTEDEMDGEEVNDEF